MKDIIQRQLESYEFVSPQEELNVLKEISQEVLLYGLAKANFFQKVLFQGGTCLRILHGIERFSEDLDFSLKSSDLQFNLMPYLEKAIEITGAYGYEWEISGADRMDKNVRSRFLKDSAIKKLLSFKHGLGDKKIRIKIEIDVNPPESARYEPGYVNFPVDFVIAAHDSPSLLAGKCHALLCRSYAKGRDWYDYLWHIKKGTPVNVPMLKEALNQTGPWKGKKNEINGSWVREEICKKIEQIDWREIKRDVSRFLRAGQKESVKVWSRDFFMAKTKKLTF